MGSWLLAVALVLALAGPAQGDDVVVVHEARTPETGGDGRGPRRSGKIRHVAVIRNASAQPIRGLRVTVELRDYFGQVLWAAATTPTPSSLKPGETATLSLLTPNLEAYRKTGYRFDYRGRAGDRPTR